MEKARECSWRAASRFSLSVDGFGSLSYTVNAIQTQTAAAGLEPATNDLTGRCSTIELRRCGQAWRSNARQVSPCVLTTILAFTHHFGNDGFNHHTSLAAANYVLNVANYEEIAGYSPRRTISYSWQYGIIM
jgi:hypothetical protein